MEPDRVKEQEMKDILRDEYVRRLTLVMRSILNGGNKIKAVNTWAVALLRYSRGVIRWQKNELQNMDRMTRNRRWWQGIRSCTAPEVILQECIYQGRNGEEDSLQMWSLCPCGRKQFTLVCKELRGGIACRIVGKKGTVKVDEARDSKENKKSE